MKEESEMIRSDGLHSWAAERGPELPSDESINEPWGPSENRGARGETDLALKNDGTSGERGPNEVIDFLVDYLCQRKPMPLKDILDQIERDIIYKVLLMAHGNQKRTARFLGIKYTTLNVKIKKHHIKIIKKPIHDIS